MSANKPSKGSGDSESLDQMWRWWGKMMKVDSGKVRIRNSHQRGPGALLSPSTLNYQPSMLCNGRATDLFKTVLSLRRRRTRIWRLVAICRRIPPMVRVIETFVVSRTYYAFWTWLSPNQCVHHSSAQGWAVAFWHFSERRQRLLEALPLWCGPHCSWSSFANVQSGTEVSVCDRKPIWSMCLIKRSCCSTTQLVTMSMIQFPLAKARRI